MPGAGGSWLVAQFPAPLKGTSPGPTSRGAGNCANGHNAPAPGSETAPLELYSAVFRASALLSIELWTLKDTASER